MNTKTLWAIGLLIVLVALGVYGYASYTPTSESQSPSGVVSNENQPQVEAAVIEYGATLQKPSKINIVSITPRASGRAFESYQVEANVVELANTAGAEPMGVYPISLTVEKKGEAWVITGVIKGAYSELPQRRTITGFWECLPHKDRTGPQTMECAFGIAVDQSDGHYAVDTSLMSTYPVDFPTGTHVRVEGIVTPANQLSSPQKYDIDGIIRATSIQKL